MWYDTNSQPHVSPSDAVTAEGLAHIDQCSTCRFLLNQCGPITVKVELDDEPFRLGSDAARERIAQLATYGFTVDSIVRRPVVQVDPRPRVFAETYRWSLRCWAGFHRWYETNTDYELCTRCGKEERLY